MCGRCVGYRKTSRSLVGSVRLVKRRECVRLPEDRCLSAGGAGGIARWSGRSAMCLDGASMVAYSNLQTTRYNDYEQVVFVVNG